MEGKRAEANRDQELTEGGRGSRGNRQQRKSWKNWKRSGKKRPRSGP